MSPQRIQRRRTKGWRMPAGAVYVGRPTMWGNPWRVGDVLGADIDGPYRMVGAPITPELAVALYRAALFAPETIAVRGKRVLTGLYFEPADVVRELAGHDLACWCPLDQPCHADVVLEVANR